MRALIRFKSKISDDELVEAAKELMLWPPFDQADPEAVKRKDEILATISDEDRLIADRTFRYVLYSDVTRTWGTLHHWENRIDIRFKHHDSGRLKVDCEKVIEYLQKPAKYRHEFIDNIHVLEPNSSTQAYLGRIRPPGTWKDVRVEKKSELQIAMWASIVSIAMLASTFPWSGDVPYDPIKVWLFGILDRIGTGTIVTAAIAYLNLVLYYVHLRRSSGITWEFD